MAAAQAEFVFSGLNAREGTKWSPSGEYGSVGGAHWFFWKQESLPQGKLGLLGRVLVQGTEDFCPVWATETPRKTLWAMDYTKLFSGLWGKPSKWWGDVCAIIYAVFFSLRCFLCALAEVLFDPLEKHMHLSSFTRLCRGGLYASMPSEMTFWSHVTWVHGGRKPSWVHEGSFAGKCQVLPVDTICVLQVWQGKPGRATLETCSDEGKP